jgi:hypothetical protein
MYIRVFLSVRVHARLLVLKHVLLLRGEEFEGS